MWAEYWSFEIDIGGNPNLETSHLLRKVKVLKNNSKLSRKTFEKLKSLSSSQRRLDFDEPLFLKAGSRPGHLREISRTLTPVTFSLHPSAPRCAHSLSHDNNDGLKTFIGISLHTLSDPYLHMLPLSLWSCVPA